MCFLILSYINMINTIIKALCNRMGKRIFSDALFQCIGKLNDIFRYLFNLNLAVLFCFSIVRHASTQLRMPAPRGMASQHLQTFERFYLNNPSVVTIFVVTEQQLLCLTSSLYYYKTI